MSVPAVGAHKRLLSSSIWRHASTVVGESLVDKGRLPVAPADLPCRCRARRPSTSWLRSPCRNRSEVAAALRRRVGQHVDLAASSRAIGAPAPATDLGAAQFRSGAGFAVRVGSPLGGGDSPARHRRCAGRPARPGPSTSCSSPSREARQSAPVGYDRLPRQFAEPWRSVSCTWRADDGEWPGRLRVLGHRYWLSACRKAGYDSARRVGQRAVQIEDHQLRRFTRRHLYEYGAWRAIQSRSCRSRSH